MNPFMSEQLAQAKAADWSRAAEQRRLSNLATRHDLPGQRLPTSQSPRVAARLATWADHMRTIRHALMNEAIRAATGTPKEEGVSGSRTHNHSKSF